MPGGDTDGNGTGAGHPHTTVPAIARGTQHGPRSGQGAADEIYTGKSYSTTLSVNEHSELLLLIVYRTIVIRIHY